MEPERPGIRLGEAAETERGRDVGPRRVPAEICCRHCTKHASLKGAAGQHAPRRLQQPYRRGATAIPSAPGARIQGRQGIAARRRPYDTVLRTFPRLVLVDAELDGAADAPSSASWSWGLSATGAGAAACGRAANRLGSAEDNADMDIVFSIMVAYQTEVGPASLQGHYNNSEIC